MRRMIPGLIAAAMAGAISMQPVEATTEPSPAIDPTTIYPSRQARRAAERALAKAKRRHENGFRAYGGRVSGAVVRSKYMPHVGNKERGRYAQA